MADKCATPQELKDRAQTIAIKLVGQGRIGLDSQIAYFFENSAMDKFMALAPYFKDAYRGLKGAVGGVQEKNSLWGETQIEQFDIPTYIKTLQDGQERKEKIRQFNERRQQDASSFDIRPAPIFNGATIAEGPNAKPALRYAFVDELPEFPTYITEEQYPVFDTPDGAHQVFGVNAMLDAYSKGKRAFFLADRQGVGKTMQILAAAIEISLKDQTKPVLIVVENTQIIDSRFKADARLLNKTALHHFNSSRIEFTTYRSLSKKAGQNYSAIFYDESQNIANFNSAHKTAMGMQSDFVVFSTGTPFETPLQSVLFVAKMEGVAENDAADSLGFRIIEGISKAGKSFVRMETYEKDDFKFYMQYATAIDQKVRGYVRSGQYLKRQYPFWGDVFVTDMTQAMPLLWMNNISNIDAYFRTRINNYKMFVEGRGETDMDWRHKEQIERYGQQRLMNIMKATETAKAAFIWKEMEDHLAAGFQVVVATNFVGDADMQGKLMLEIEGIGGIEATKKKNGAGQNIKDIILEPTLFHKLKDRLEKAGVPYSELHGDIDSTKRKKETVSEREQMIQDFQSGKNKVMLTTFKSGSTGIDLDDQVGDAPRYAIIATKGFSEKTIQQFLYRFSRRNTKSKAKINFADAQTKSDQRSGLILSRKKAILDAVMDESANVEDANVNAAMRIKEEFTNNKADLERKGILSEQEFYADFMKFRRENGEATLDEFLNEVKKC